MNRFTVIFISALLLTSINPVSSETEFKYPYNFELDLFTNLRGPFNGVLGEYIRNSLLPLGIHLNIIPYRSDTLWYTYIKGSFFANFDYDAPSYDIMSGGINWQSGLNRPEYAPKYHSDKYWTCVLTPVCNDEWAQWMIQDAKISQTEIDNLLENYETEENMTRAVELSNDFSKMYFDHMLYELPLYAKTYDAYYWDGFDLSYLRNFIYNTDYYQSIRHTYESIMMGLQVTKNHPERELMRNATTFNILRDVPSNLVLDLLQPKKSDVLLNEKQLINSLLTKGLENSYGDSIERYPDIALSWIKTDWVDENGTTHINGKNKFTLRDDVYWYNNAYSPNPDYNGKEKVTVNDFKFTLDMYRNHPDYIPEIDGKNNFYLADRLDNLIKYTINETENSIILYGNNTMKWRDLTMWGLGPTPSFLLNKTLTYNETVSGTPQELASIGLSSYDTAEWNTYESSPVTAGAYEIVEFIPEKKLTLRLRENYFYPNEWDSVDHHFNLNKSKKEPTYFNYNTTANEPYRKPTKLFFDVLNIEPSGNMTLEMIIEEGYFDVFITKDEFLGEEVKKLQDRSRYIRHHYISTSGPETMYFNLTNPHLKKLNVRKAIAMAIDLDKISEFTKNLWIPQRSITPMYFKYSDPVFYKDPFIPSYTSARDLMRKENYTALESDIIEVQILSMPPITVNPVSSHLIFPLIVTLVVISSHKRRKNSLSGRK